MDAVGLRWEIPYHLLDAMFYCVDNRMTVPFHDSGIARAVLGDLKSALVQGYEQKLLQVTSVVRFESSKNHHI